MKMRRILSQSILLISILSFGCNKETNEEQNIIVTPEDHYSYVIQNNSNVIIGVRDLNNNVANVTWYVGQDFNVNPGESLTFATSDTIDDPYSFIEEMIVTTKDFGSKFRDLMRYDITQDGMEFIFEIFISNYDAREISHSSFVSFTLHNGNFVGFYNQDGNYDYQHFFSSNDDFQSYEISEAPMNVYDISIIETFDETLFAYHPLGGGYVIKSSDGGESWTYMPASGGTYLITTDFLSHDMGYIIKLYHSSIEGGDTYIYKYKNNECDKVATIEGHIVQACNFENENEGVIFTSTYTSGSWGYPDNNLFRFKTSDGGTTWDSTNQITDFCTIAKFIVMDSGKFIALTGSYFNNFDFYYYSDDYGFNWWKISIELEYSEKILDMCFINQTTGYLKSGNSDSFGHIYKTTNGGSTWLKVSNLPQPGNEIFFENDSSGILTESHGGYSNMLYATNNGGKTWREVLYEYNFHYGDY